MEKMNKYQLALELVKAIIDGVNFGYKDAWEEVNKTKFKGKVIAIYDKSNIETLQQAIDKETEKKPIRIHPPFGDNVPIKKYPKIYGCPCCKNEVKQHYVYCPFCGQKLKDERGEK
jgi:hypothetical protein